MRFRPFHKLLIIFVAAAWLSSCSTVDDNRIPNMPVNIALGDAGIWNTYGVSGFGTSRRFILTSGLAEPPGFPYNAKSATGFGGVLLIEGLDPFSATPSTPLAYDLACPVERDPDVRVYVEEESYNAVCPVCGSVYDVTLAGGGPISGIAVTGKYKYGLKIYSVIPSGTGGYFISN